MYKRSFFVLFIFLTISFSLIAEEESLYERTLYSDISTASYYELLNWSRELGLDDKGNIEQLQNQLYQNYNIDLNAQFSKDTSETTIVKIVSADSTDYYTIDEIDEEYVRISGRVKLIVKQPSRNISHTIEADSVIFNQTINTMTASGNVEYVKEENGKLEEYTGDNLTFNVQSWKGVILKGDFKKTQEVNNQEMEFIFSGESIYKGEGDVVVLNDGSISSCDIEDKHYQIKAKKIWILGPDEWALLSGVLYIGNIPVLYIPFYHLPGNDMFFNPAIGTDTRTGYFIQSTSYLLGEKQSSEEDDSFFINVADSDENYKLVPNGLFLFKEKGEESESSTDFIKYKLDYYSRLGGYTGFEGSIAKLWEFNTINFDIGLAVSKSIKPPETGVSTFYSNYFSENDNIEEWNSSNLFGVSLPFRWGMLLDFKLFTFNVKLGYLSDPWFISDFNVREENFDWLNYLLAQTTAQEDVDTTSNDTLEWSISGNVTIPNQWAGNIINSFSFSPINLNIMWSKKENYSSLYKEPDLPATPLPGEPLFDADNFTDLKPYDPGREFFYPDSYTLPQASLNLSGILLDFNTNKIEKLSEEKDYESGSLRSPWSDNQKDLPDNGVESSEKEFRNPENFSNLTIADESEFFSTKIDYRFSGYFNFIAYTNSDLWNQPSEIDFSISKSTFTNNNTFNLNYAFNFMNQIFSLTGQNSITSKYLEYFGDVNSDEGINAKQNQNFRWYNDLNFKISPLKSVPYFSDSYINYEFNADLFRRDFDLGDVLDNTDDTFKDTWIGWNDDSITAHKASASFNFAIPFIKTAVLFDTTLPPIEIEQSFTPSIEVSFFNWTNTVNMKVLYKNSIWTLDPLNFTSIFNPIEKISISEQLKYSFEDSLLTSSISQLKLWDFNAVFNMAYTTDYEWDKNTSTLINNGEAFVPSSLSLAYNYKYESPLLWKNRIKMDFSINSSFNMNLQQYNLTSLNLELIYNLHIFQFLDFNITFSTSNNHMFLYIPELRDYYGITNEYNFFEDLFKSFNIFSPNQKDRYDSFFNMNFVKVSLVHKLHDWDLEFSYSGKPLVETGSFTTTWDSTVSILVRWNPIEKIKVKVDHLDDEWNVDTEFDD